MSDFLLILGCALLCIALRSFTNPYLHKLGTFCVLGTSFLAGSLLTGAWEIGFFCAASWLLLPWLEILTRVRHLRLPTSKQLKHRQPPTFDEFPILDDLTGAMKDEGYSQVDDLGWDWDDHRQFFRIFHHEETRSYATICLIEQEETAFFYITVSSRGTDGTIWTTWNYPFSFSMKPIPELKINRVRGYRSVLEIMTSHQSFLDKNRVQRESLSLSRPEEIQGEIQRDLQNQISHNLSVGLLLPTNEGTVRYSWRGMFFIWVQFLRDFVRIS